MKRAGVIGWPVAHSRSPIIHQYWLRKYGIDGQYDKIAVEPGGVPEFFAQLRQGALVGCNVTIPHKEQVNLLVDHLTPEAVGIGAANTVWRDGDKLLASNTDCYGYMAHLDATAPDWKQGAREVLIIGAGGAARAIAYGFVKAGVERVVISNRTEQRAEAVAAGLGPAVKTVRWGAWDDAAKTASVIVNTTALGMANGDALVMDFSAVRDDCVVSDAVYVPLLTPFLAAARQRGLKTVDGLGMLLHQAVPGFEAWFGVRPEVTDDLFGLVVADLEAH